MSRVKLVLLGLLAVLTAVMVASASASAAECKKEATKKFILCLGEPLTLTEGTLTLHVKADTGAEYVLESPALGIKLLSKAVEGLGELSSSVANGVKVLNLMLRFTGITIDGVSHCAVQNEAVSTLRLKGVVENNEKEKLLFTPETGAQFASFSIVNSGGTCLIAGAYKVNLLAGEKGGELCTAPLETTRTEQLVTCTVANSDLEFAEEPAGFGGNFLATVLNKGEAVKWAVLEGK